MKRGEKPKDYYRNEERAGGLLHLPDGACYFCYDIRCIAIRNQK